MANEKSFGAQLRDAREASGDSLDAIARTTRISRRYLQALEAGDLESLPGSAFEKGYIRAYSEFLGIDPQPILEAYHNEARRLGRGTPESARQTIEEMSRLLNGGTGLQSKRSAALALGVALAIGLTSVVVWLSRSGDVETEPATNAEVEIAQSTPTPSVRQSPAFKTSTPEPSSPTTSKPGMVVTDHGVGTGISGRDLVGRTNRLREGTEAFFWTRVEGGSSGQIIRHLWYYEGRVVMRAELTVGSAYWRTFSRFTLPAGSAGNWWVEARAADNRLLAREAFECLPHIES
ncbi:MAG TPA: DUF2914 domain-containing protein [Vicinamibacteria bacterium]|nr:DUF2914 domain-containing protein [Vicinamibacteria bacterium]